MFWVLQKSGVMGGWVQQGFGLELYDCICITLSYSSAAAQSSLAQLCTLATAQHYVRR